MRPAWDCQTEAKNKPLLRQAAHSAHREPARCQVWAQQAHELGAGTQAKAVSHMLGLFKTLQL